MARPDLAALLLIIVLASVQCHGDATMSDGNDLPSFEALLSSWALPDPLTALDGTPILTPEAWRTVRRPEIVRLFSHYMFGSPPERPGGVEATQERLDASAFSGKATKRELTLRYGPEGTPPIHLLLVTPNRRETPAPIFLGCNFYGNHSVLDDPEIPLSTVWLPDRAEGVVRHRATEAARGTATHRWPMELAVDRGYGVATFYHGDLDPDENDFTNGVHPHFPGEDGTIRGLHSWGTLAAWAWGISRVIDHLLTDPEVDGSRIAVMGHSRNGKVSLLAGALDERIALVVSNQSGCGGAALSRRRRGETLAWINSFYPHWFCSAFHDFSRHEDRLPLDQHMLIALIAPRPVLVASAAGDLWADPQGEFLSLVAADPVYRLLGSEGLPTKAWPPVNTLVEGVLGYHIRPGEHAVGEEDWTVFLDFADLHFSGSGPSGP